MGAGLIFSVLACASAAVDASCYWSTGNQTFNYPAPVILPNTLRLAGTSNYTSVLQLVSSFASGISFNGLNFANDSTRFAVFYGPSSKPTLYACILSEAQTTDTVVTCTTESFAAGAALQFTVIAGGSTYGWTVRGTDVINYPAVSSHFDPNDSRIRIIKRCWFGFDSLQDLPQILSVTGCQDFANRTSGLCTASHLQHIQLSLSLSFLQGCPTQGGVWITIGGTNFKSPVAVTINGENCAPTRNVLGTHIECQLPAGAGI